jgi:hypothetical protein
MAPLFVKFKKHHLKTDGCLLQYRPKAQVCQLNEALLKPMLYRIYRDVQYV